MKTILCYGDSNTFGTNPHGGRWPETIRWTGRLQHLLGAEYRVIEEGCGGRTTVWSDDLERDRNGREFLPVALASHKPLDLVILMLGTNDMKTRFQVSPREIAEGARQLAELVQHYPYGPYFPVPQVLLVSPVYIGADIENSPFPGFDHRAIAKSHDLARWFAKAAGEQHCSFMDAAAFAHPSGTDNLHMEADSHEALADAFAARVREILGNGNDTR